jgi:exonuclease SbcD
MLRILHTSDWHLGHTLHDLPRRHEHASFLRWLLEQLAREQVDALVVAGDVFDTANPSAEAQETLYGFLAAARRAMPELDIVVIGGNHDSAGRLDAPDPLLRALGIRVVGGLPRSGKRVEVDRLVVPLRDRSGAVGAWLAAVPFLRAFDLPFVDEGDPLVEGVRRVYDEILTAARAKREPGQALLATGHCYMTGTALSSLSERKVLGGNQHALPADIFPADVAYVALGHLHLAQTVGGREGVRYSGSPIPLSLAEAPYAHQVVVADLDGADLHEVRSLLVPRAVPIVKVPAGGPRPLDEVLPLLLALPPLDPALAPEARPYLEVEVAVPKPEPSLRRKIEEAIAGKAARLVRIGVRLEGSGLALPDVFTTTSLKDHEAEDVFRQRYRRSYPNDPPAELLSAFHELVELVAAEEP